MAHQYYCENLNSRSHLSMHTNVPEGVFYARTSSPSGQYLASTIKAEVPWK